jgi:hypothetical protein
VCTETCRSSDVISAFYQIECTCSLNKDELTRITFLHLTLPRHCTRKDCSVAVCITLDTGILDTLTGTGLILS